MYRKHTEGGGTHAPSGGDGRHEPDRFFCHGAWRIPERVLFSLAFLLGAPGAYAGMMVFRHKTQHRRFAVGLPLLSAAQIIFILWALFS